MTVIPFVHYLSAFKRAGGICEIVFWFPRMCKNRSKGVTGITQMVHGVDVLVSLFLLSDFGLFKQAQVVPDSTIPPFSDYVTSEWSVEE